MLTFLVLISEQAGHPLALERMNPSTMMAAMVTSFKGKEAPLAELIAALINNNCD